VAGSYECDYELLGSIMCWDFLRSYTAINFSLELYFKLIKFRKSEHMTGPEIQISNEVTIWNNLKTV
jgi:hypothetical protein